MRRIGWAWLGSVLLAALTGAVIMPDAASAHSALRSTVPASGATVTAPLTEVTLTFNERVKQRFSVVAVNGPDGVSYSDGALRVVDQTVHQPVRALKSGTYTVGWRTVSADDHPIQGQYTFVVALPAGAEPTSSAPAQPASSQPAPGEQARGQQTPAGEQTNAADPPPATRTVSGAGQGGWPWYATVGFGVGVVAILAAVVMALTRRRRPQT